ncbi:MAG: hypothetical protein ABJP79_03880 [Tateyamaria sp.]|uniref:hypothetical protein n=1 Tax=Tateyamaria sp. TaxID=1929288 RepID=UPI00329E0CC1
MHTSDERSLWSSLNGSISRNIEGKFRICVPISIDVTSVAARETYGLNPSGSPETFTGFNNVDQCILIPTR